MEASEVRIGNLLNHNNGFVVGPFTVNSIHISDLERGNDYAKEYEPIPLTEEWLIKFGFGFKEYDSLGWIESPSDMFYSLKKRGEYYYPYETDNVIQFELKYVHQLQNLYFALTGEELGLQDT